MTQRWLILWCCALLAACAGAPTMTPLTGAPLFHDTAFAPTPTLIAVDEVFRASPEMRQFLSDAQPASARHGDPRRHLIDLLYRGGKTVALDYDASVTRTAAEAFTAGAGNCLSLMIMTASFARQLGLPVQFRSVEVDESWSRNGDLLFTSGHVNIALGRQRSDLRFAGDAEQSLVVDFVPVNDFRRQRAQSISEATVLAMFMNNRAAESMARGSLDEAYWYAREAILQDSAFLTGYNTLGVIYMRRERPAWARQVFEAVLDHEPQNAKVMGNLVGALKELGLVEDATRWAARLANLEPFPPYHFFNSGIQAMQARDYAAARDLFGKEVARQAYNPEFHFWLAQANFRLGRLREARHHMEQAMEHSSTQRDHAIYAAKLDWLRGQNTN